MSHQGTTQPGGSWWLWKGQEMWKRGGAGVWSSLLPLCHLTPHAHIHFPGTLQPSCEHRWKGQGWSPSLVPAILHQNLLPVP